MRKKYILGQLMSGLVLLPQTLLAESWQLSTDNDGLFGTDKYYSSGMFFQYGNRASNLYYNIELGTQIWTPSDIENTKATEIDRPYAGTLFAQTQLGRLTAQKHLKTQLMLGIIGPKSGAKNIQTWVHRLIGSPTPVGWERQIQNRAIIEVEIESEQIIHRNQYQEWGYGVRGGLGNFRPDVGANLIWRYGENLSESYGSISPSKGYRLDANYLPRYADHWFIFAGADLSYRFYDLTIQGKHENTLGTITPEKIHFNFSQGIIWQKGQWGLSFIVSAISSDSKQMSPKMHWFSNLGIFYKISS